MEVFDAINALDDSTRYAIIALIRILGILTGATVYEDGSIVP